MLILFIYFILMIFFFFICLIFHSFILYRSFFPFIWLIVFSLLHMTDDIYLFYMDDFLFFICHIYHLFNLYNQYFQLFYMGDLFLFILYDLLIYLSTMSNGYYVLVFSIVILVQVELWKFFLSRGLMPNIFFILVGDAHLSRGHLMGHLEMSWFADVRLRLCTFHCYCNVKMLPHVPVFISQALLDYRYYWLPAPKCWKPEIIFMKIMSDLEVS